MPNDVIRRGRLSGERTGEMMHFLSSMKADRCIADADILVDIAHVLMLHKQQIIGREPARKLLEALLDLFDNGIPEAAFDVSFEDIHAGIETLLVETLGEETGGRLHIARSRNDEVVTCMRMRLRDDILRQLSILCRLRETLLAIAGEHTGSIMPGFTHFQYAQPTTLAHHLLGYEQAFGRDFDRIRECFARVNQSPLGAAAFASTGYPINREFTAQLLGFDGMVVNTMDAVASRDFALELLSNLSILMIHVSRLCEELILWSSSSIRFVSLDDAFCSTSSIMPQKKNPDTAEIMRAKSASVLGAYMAALATVKGLPMSYNRDLQEMTPSIWRGTRDAKHSTRLLVDMLATAEFDTGRMREEAGRGDTTATDLADMLVRRFDLPFRTAHSIVARTIQEGSIDLSTLESSGNEIAHISLQEQGLTEAQVHEALDVEQSVSIRRADGGPSPLSVRIALEERRKELGDDRIELEQKIASIAEAKQRLVYDARRIVS
jgi:argininosuccinate lyase